jgi:plasmid replication initiation protein
MQQPQVYKSNALVEAQYRLSVAEQRIMLACISQVRRDHPITDNELYSVSAAEIAAMSGTSTKQAYRELEKAALRLKRREVRLIDEPNGQGRKRKVMLTGWVQTIIYIEEEGRVELRFTKDMLPYLTQLSTQFTKYALGDVAKMTSAHAIRLYELLCQWRTEGKKEWPIEWLREAFQLGGKYPTIKDLKRRVIEPAVEQINELSPLWVKWDQRKTGQHVSHLTFTFGEKTDSKKPKQAAANKRRKSDSSSSPTPGGHAMFGISPEVIAQHMQPGDSWQDAAIKALEAQRSAVPQKT